MKMEQTQEVTVDYLFKYTEWEHTIQLRQPRVQIISISYTPERGLCLSVCTDGQGQRPVQYLLTQCV